MKQTPIISSFTLKMLLTQKFLELRPELKTFQKVAYQFGPQAVQEYVHRKSNRIFGGNVALQKKKLLYRGKLTKYAVEKLTADLTSSSQE